MLTAVSSACTVHQLSLWSSPLAQCEINRKITSGELTDKYRHAKIIRETYRSDYNGHSQIYAVSTGTMVLVMDRAKAEKPQAESIDSHRYSRHCLPAKVMQYVQIHSSSGYNVFPCSFVVLQCIVMLLCLLHHLCCLWITAMILKYHNVHVVCNLWLSATCKLHCKIWLGLGIGLRSGCS